METTEPLAVTLRILAEQAGVTLTDEDLTAAIPLYEQRRRALEGLMAAVSKIPVTTPSAGGPEHANRAGRRADLVPIDGSVVSVPTMASDVRQESELCLLPISELARCIHARTLSPIQLARAYLARIEQFDPQLRSYLTVTAELAEKDARRAELELDRRRDRGPLHGIPIALKDLFDVAGVRTTANSRLLWDRLPDHDSTVAARLRRAGAVLLGKLNLHELALGAPGPDDLGPPARNPWDLVRTPGGSSSGSGAAVAAGLCAGSIGSDTGGSIRQPAAFSGIVGLKPTYGRVSRYGVVPLSSTFDHVGPLVRTVPDAAILLQAIAGHDPLDASSADVPVPDYTTGLSGNLDGLRVGVSHAFIESVPGVNADVFTAFGSALDVVRELGAELCEVSISHTSYMDAVFFTIEKAEAAAFHRQWLRTERHRYGKVLWNRVIQGLFISGPDYVQALRGRALICEEMERVMKEVDVLATPTMPGTAPMLTELASAGPGFRPAFTGLFNITGQPAISVPCGFDRQGLPIGLMLAARHFDEPSLLRVAAAFERITPWHRCHPALGSEH